MLTLFSGARESLGWMLPLLLLCDIIALFLYWRQWDWTNLRSMLPGGILGVGIGWLALSRIDDKTLTHLIGGLAVVFSILQFARARLQRDLTLTPGFWHGLPLGRTGGQRASSTDRLTPWSNSLTQESGTTGAG